MRPVISFPLFGALLWSDGNVYYVIITMLRGIQFFDSASGVAGLAGAIASNPIDVVKVSQVVVSARFCKNVVV